MARGTDIMTHSRLRLHPDPERTVIRPFDVSDPAGFDQQAKTRAQRIAERVLTLDGKALTREIKRVMRQLEGRHRDVDIVVARRFEEMAPRIRCTELTTDQQTLIGAYFSEEYSFESAALFNPSMVRHSNQEKAPKDGVCFALSLRGIGEGHLSSVTFREGTWDPVGGFRVETPSKSAVAPRIEQGDDFDDGAVKVMCENSRDISESILFPVTASQARGIEDMRLCQFTEDDGSTRHYGTYTAYSGSEARCELMDADDFRTMTLQKMTGSAAGAKGMALFPRRIGGRYAMLGRLDEESIFLLASDDPTTWNGGEAIIKPRFPWEFVQMGNCGSPIEIDEGWLVLTHGVGSVRNYCIGAALLDKDDPRKVLGRMALPLVHPSPKERDGYVPNVVYSCGAMVHDRMLLLPYGVADNFASFASCSVDDLLARME